MKDEDEELEEDEGEEAEEDKAELLAANCPRGSCCWAIVLSNEATVGALKYVAKIEVRGIMEKRVSRVLLSFAAELCGSKCPHLKEGMP